MVSASHGCRQRAVLDCSLAWPFLNNGQLGDENVHLHHLSICPDVSSSITIAHLLYRSDLHLDFLI